MHTNSTPNYNLPQFVGTDIINPLTDINDAYSTIDTTMKNIADGEAADASAITALQTAVGDSANGLVKAVNDLEAQNGDAVLTTSAQTLSGAINELDNAVDANTSNISTLVQKVGNDTLTTTASTCTGAINELNGKIGIKQIKVLESIKLIADGVKTNAAMITDVFNTFASIVANLPSNHIVEPKGGTLPRWCSINAPVHSQGGDTLTLLSFNSSNVDYSGSPIYFWEVRATTTASNTHCDEITISSGGAVTFTDLSNSVPASGTEFSIVYNEYEV